MNNQEYLGWVGTVTAVASALGKGIGSITKGVKKKRAKQLAASRKKMAGIVERLKAKVKEKQEAGEMPVGVSPDKIAKVVLKKAGKELLKKKPPALKRKPRIVRKRRLTPTERVQVKTKLDTMRRAPVYAPPVSRGPAPVYEPAIIPAPRIVERERAGPGMMLPLAIGAGALILMLATKKGK